MKEYLGGIYYFLEKRKLESLQEVERRDTPQKPAVQATPKPEAAVSGKLTYEQRKEQEKQLRKLRRTVEGSRRNLPQSKNRSPPTMRNSLRRPPTTKPTTRPTTT